MGAALRGFPPVTQRQHRDDDRDQLVGRLHLRQLQDALLGGAADLYGQARGYVGGPTGSDFENDNCLGRGVRESVHNLNRQTSLRFGVSTNGART